MPDYVTVPVEGDLWDYNAVADIARTIASEFLERFYIGGKREPALQALLNKFMEHIGPDPVNSDYDMRTHRMYATMAYRPQWEVGGGGDVCDELNQPVYDEDSKRLVSVDTGKVLEPRIKNSPVIGAVRAHVVIRIDRVRSNMLHELIQKSLERLLSFSAYIESFEKL